MLAKLRLFVKEHMEVVFIAIGTVLFGLAFGHIGTNKPIVMWAWFALGFGIISFLLAIFFAWRKDRKAEQRATEREKREIEREKRDQARFDKENAPPI